MNCKIKKFNSLMVESSNCLVGFFLVQLELFRFSLGGVGGREKGKKGQKKNVGPLSEEPIGFALSIEIRNLSCGDRVNELTSVLSLPRLDLPFAFTIMHGIRRLVKN